MQRRTTRLDVELARRGLAESREGARRLVMAGRVRVDSRPAAKPDQRVGPANVITIIEAPSFASRAAHKLIAALDAFGIDVSRRMALDVGASTGGFTDVLLKRDAGHVIAVDVGYGQLALRLRDDARVTVMDRTNARYLEPDCLPYLPDLATIDASFISLRMLLPAVARCTAAHADIIALIKPQFEVGREKVGKGGVVRDQQARQAAVAGVLDFARTIGLAPAGVIESPIRGTKGNLEFLALLRR